jgi:hypothetical protein
LYKKLGLNCDYFKKEHGKKLLNKKGRTKREPPFGKGLYPPTL